MKAKMEKMGNLFSEIDASKIPVEWYSWIHFTPNKIEKIIIYKNMNGKNLINLI